jgi:hypothetical protein
VNIEVWESGFGSNEVKGLIEYDRSLPGARFPRVSADCRLSFHIVNSGSLLVQSLLALLRS